MQAARMCSRAACITRSSRSGWGRRRWRISRAESFFRNLVARHPLRVAGDLQSKGECGHPPPMLSCAPRLPRARVRKTLTLRMSAPTLHIIHGQPSWSFRSSHVHANLTKLGGHLAPVAFRLAHRLVTPFSVAPWAEEKLPPDTPALLRALRGDFFCAPFGGNGTPWRGEKHPPHGETANSRWQLKS